MRNDKPVRYDQFVPSSKSRESVKEETRMALCLERAKNVACEAVYGCRYTEERDCRAVSMLAYPLTKFFLRAERGGQEINVALIKKIRSCMRVAGYESFLAGERICSSHEIMVWDILPLVEDFLDKIK